MAAEAPKATSAVRARSAFATRYYLAILKRRKWVFVACMAVPLLLAGLRTVTQEKRYGATAQVLISRQNLALALTGTPDPTSFAQDFLTILQTQAQISRSPAVGADVVRTAKIPGLTSDDFFASSSTAPEKDADLLDFYVERHVPAEAVKLASIYGDAFTRYRRELDTVSLRRAEEALNARLREAKSSGSAQSLINNLEAKKQEIDTLQALQTSNAVVISRPSDASQVAPNIKRNIALGIIGGLILSALVIAILEALDTRVRSESEVEERLGQSLLAVVPAPPKRTSGLVMMTAPHAPEAESFRLLRVNLEFSDLDRSVRSILVTSSVEGEGKTTTVSNLAVATARAGRRVILVDLDLRRPAVATSFGLNPGLGITDVVRGRVDIEGALQSVDVGANGSLQVLAAGPLPPNPGEFVASHAVGEIIRRLEEQADLVLIDAPPTLPVGDVPALSQVVGGIFLCVRVPGVRRQHLDRLRAELGTVNARVMGFVLTGKIAQGQDAYRYGYGDAAPAEEESDAPTELEPSRGRAVG